VNAVSLVGENLCLTGSSDTFVKVWDVRKLDTAVLVLSVHTGKLTCIKSTEVGNKISFSPWFSSSFSFFSFLLFLSFFFFFF
jgi:WD40 repeat protein